MSDDASRLHPRRYLRVPVQVEVSADGRSCGLSYAINLSMTGMCLQCAEPKEAKQPIGLRFRLTPSDPWLEFDGEVVWCSMESVRAPGMSFFEVGVRFLEIPEAQEELLRAFVDRNSRYCDAAEPVLGKTSGWSG